MKLYKLTDEDGRTFNDTQWGEGVTHSGTGEGELCGPGWIHAYTDPLLAILLNPLHAGFKNPQLWEAEGDIAKNDHGLKVGCQTLTTIKIIDLPVVSDVQRVAFGILCAMEVYKNANWLNWAHNWLNGADRSTYPAYFAYAHHAAHAAARAANIDLIAIAKRALEIK